LRGRRFYRRDRRAGRRRGLRDRHRRSRYSGRRGGVVVLLEKLVFDLERGGALEKCHTPLSDTTPRVLVEAWAQPG
jgi:hypothetical protein